MNNILLLALSCMLVMSAGHPAFATEAPDSTKGTISTTGSSSNHFPPDTAEIVFGVETTELTVLEATQKNSAISERVINDLKTMIDKASGDMLQTSFYSIQPRYEYDGARKQNNFIGYLVTNQITVKTRRIHDTGKLIDRATEQGSNRVYSINFTISDNRSYCEQLLDQATKRGRFEAEVVARSLGTSITGIKSVASSCSDDNQPPIYPRSYATESVATRTAASVEPGAIRLTATVNLVFFIDSSN